ncbi:MAG: hypothetical protein LBK99_06760, partial [Opitutaceae bacterium]|nr:hypothetical protein [Opitutaceae bacterium]
PEFFDLEHFHDTASFIASVTTYQHFFNFARKNRSRSNLAPADLLAVRSPLLPPSHPPSPSRLPRLSLGSSSVWSSRVFTATILARRRPRI